MTSRASRAAARFACTLTALVSLGLSGSASAAPALGEPRVVVSSGVVLDHTTATEALVGNGTDLFAAYVQPIGGNRTILRGSYFNAASPELTPEVPTGIVLSGSLPFDRSPSGTSRRPALAMNGLGSVLGVYASDVFRVGRDGSVRSIPLLTRGLPAAASFPTAAGPQSAVLVGDTTAAGTFLFVACSKTECSLQRLADDGTPLGAETTLFTFAPGSESAALVAAVHVPEQGFRVVAAQRQQVLTAVVSADAITTPVALEETLAPACPSWSATSVRVGRGASADTVQTRITTTCDTISAVWITLDGLAARTETLCGAASGIDDCQFTSTNEGLFVSVGATVTAVATATTHTLGSWVAPVRAAPAPGGGALAVAANLPALARLVPEGTPVDGATAWRTLTEGAELHALDGTTTATAEGVDFRAGVSRGAARALLKADGLLVALGDDVTAPPFAVAEPVEGSTFLSTNANLVLVAANAPAVVPFGGMLALAHGAGKAVGLGLQTSNGGPFLYSYSLDPAAFGPPAGGALPNTPAVVTGASLVSLVESSVVARLAFDGTSYLAVFTRAGHLDGALLGPTGARLAGPFPISSALHSQSSPQVTALPGGGFFVVWVDARESLVQNDIYGTFVGADGMVGSPQGIPIARTALHEISPHASRSADPDHVIVVWSEYADSPRSAVQVRGAAVSRSAARARPSFLVDGGPGDHHSVGVLPAGASGVTSYYAEQGAPAGGQRILARLIGVAKRAGETCASNAECITEACVQGTCGEPAVPPDSTCGDPCAVLDPASNACVPAPRGSLPTGEGCPGYVCNGASLTCPTRCQSNADCTNNAECENQACVVVRSCTGPSELSDRGATKSCGSFRCDPVLAACFDSCTNKEQCADGLVCDELGGCVQPPSAAEGGCSASRSDPISPGWLALVAATGVLLLGRRRRRLASLAAVTAVCMWARPALAADPRVGPSEALPTVAGAAFTPVIGRDAAAMIPLALPGAPGSGLLRIADRAGAWRDGVFGAGGMVSFQPAVGAMSGRSNCDDGSVLALERATVAGRPMVWLSHYTDGPVPTHRIRVPETVVASGTCTSDGAWVTVAEATDVYERFVWASGASVQRVETREVGTVPFFRNDVIGWAVRREAAVFVVDAQGATVASFTPYASRSPVLFGAGARAVISYDQFSGSAAAPTIGVASAEAGGVAYVQAAGPALPGPAGATVVPRNDSRSITFRSGNTVTHLELPTEVLVPPAHTTATFVFPGGTSTAIVRGDRFELTFDDATHRELALPALTEVEAAATAPTSAAPRALRLASSAGGITRLLGYQADALSVFRTDAAPRALVLPEGAEAHTPADLQGLPDGRASLTTRDATTFAGHVLSATDGLAPLPLLDAATSIANLGDGIAALHFVDNAGTTRFTYRHISATVGETSRSVDVPRPTLEWGLRRTASVAAVGNDAFAVFTRGVGNGEQHLDWARIAQGTVTENLPLVRAFLLQTNPSIACDPRGQRGCLVAWEDYRKNSHDTDVYVARILPDGTTPDGEGILLAASSRIETEPSVVWTDDEDHFFVAWRDAEPAEGRNPGVDPSRIRGAFVRHDGTVEDPGGFELTDEPLDEMAPILLAGERGTFRLAYQVFVSAPDIASNQIAVRTIRAGKLRGDTCAADLECAGRACIDGICCEATCRDGCGTCNQPGQRGVCIPRADGSPSYQDRCGPFLCDGTTTSCPATCRDNADCTSTSTCDPSTRQCTGGDGTACQDEATQVDDAGVQSSCAPYRCVRGQCAQRCVSNAECAPGSVCTPGGRCEPAPPAAEGGCSAAAPGGGSSSAASIAFATGLALALGSVLRARRRRGLRSGGSGASAGSAGSRGSGASAGSSGSTREARRRSR